jgi:hypothetical protein
VFELLGPLFLAASVASRRMAKKRVHIVTAVNAKNVSKAGSTYTIRDVCGAVDGIVMNSRLYPAESLAAGIGSLEGKPAPAGHPRNAKGQVISALNGDALLTSYIGSVCKNARHEGGRTMVDIVVNEAQAKAHPDGVKLIERLDAAISGANQDPIHVSTGLLHNSIAANGESGGKKYTEIVTAVEYDHLAILLNEQGAGTPEEGVGMFLNAAGETQDIETVRIDPAPQDRRADTFLARWVRRLVGNGGASELSFEQISDGLYRGLPEHAWLREVFDRYAVWTDRDGKLWRQDYSVSSDGSVAWSGTAVEVTRRVSYEPITNRQEGNPMKTMLIAALNAAGIKTEGLDEAQLLSAYNQMVANAAVAPVEAKLTAANSKLAELETNARADEERQVAALATELATNSSLTVDDLKKLGLKRLQELKAKAAPVAAGGGGSGGGGDEFAGYSINSHFEEKK